VVTNKSTGINHPISLFNVRQDQAEGILVVIETTMLLHPLGYVGVPVDDGNIIRE
jgi:hypothetical protein